MASSGWTLPGAKATVPPPGQFGVLVAMGGVLLGRGAVLLRSGLERAI
ncbi:MAG: hypothetical protein JJE50_07300 [Actinomycetales bacterium]|nr:hypothetical protein [Actinomycetales bacterium]